jgi:cytochrome b involved in lipid metabolism
MCILSKSKELYYSQEDIDNINKNGGNLIIVNKKIYDISNIINYHPGGKDCLIKKIGQDCTKDLNFHSSKVKKILNKLYVGKLKK